MPFDFVQCSGLSTGIICELEEQRERLKLYYGSLLSSSVGKYFLFNKVSAANNFDYQENEYEKIDLRIKAIVKAWVWCIYEDLTAFDTQWSP